MQSRAEQPGSRNAGRQGLPRWPCPRSPAAAGAHPATHQPPTGHSEARGAEPRAWHSQVLWLTRSRSRRVQRAPVSARHVHWSFLRACESVFRSCDLPYFLSTRCNFLIAACIIAARLPAPACTKVRTPEIPASTPEKSRSSPEKDHTISSKSSTYPTMGN